MPPPPQSPQRRSTSSANPPTNTNAASSSAPAGGATAPAVQQTGYTIAQIFQFSAWRTRDNEVPPRLNETQPLSMFWHADKHLARMVESLQQVRDTECDKFKRRNERVHRAQRLLLETIFLIYSEMDESLKASRSYRRQLPAEDQRELEGGFSENILFAAQALSRGFRIRGIEDYTAELYEPARQLHAAVEALRLAFSTRALSCSSPPYPDMYPVLRDFDRAWTAFEQKICFCYFSVTCSARPGRSDELDMFQVLMSETLIRAVNHGYITWSQVYNFDPLVMFAVPRLCIVAALHHMPDCVNITDAEKGLRWFRPKAQLLTRLQKDLNGIGKRNLEALERLLVDTDGGATGTSSDAIAFGLCVTDVDVESTAGVAPAADHDPPGILSADASQVTLDGVPDALAAIIFSPSSGGDPCSSDSKQFTAVGSLEVTPLRKPPTLRDLFRDVCSVADDLQSGPQAREFVGVLHKVFSMHKEETEGSSKSADASPSRAS
ncbi:Lateral signaling target protein 2 [Thoreauomyces humboldtii]|nr:Lateral signaling target protein 2 [Thoreauomyces humboldtii]